MYKTQFGRVNKMRFNSAEEYYETLGFLAKSDGSTSLVWENNENQGAWGSEGRIHCHHSINRFPAPLSRKFTAGNGTSILNRINCNEFIQHIVNFHSFNMGHVQNITNIRITVPNQYLVDFDRGFNL